MFDKILIANRGEIAVRIAATCDRMGIATVAVHSDVDGNGAAVRAAGEAVALGGVSAAETYLAIDKIIAAAREAGADAVHPGYGFLSENADFARACEAAGLVFIGPAADTIATMGDKLAAKRLAAEAGVHTIPGGTQSVADEAAALDAARDIGFPVMLKAAAGGGGKGMRIVRDAAQLAENFASAAREAAASFADDRIFVEKYIARPRHIEIQILADAHGHIIHLGERECSIQRRHQKVIEEAPSPLLDEATRAAMTGQAVALAEKVDYRSAGTIEFVADAERNFFFLEMNTRLQVEHPVTEMVTGLDLVEWMIRIAAGDRLDIDQAQVKTQGWAIEARIYAEDPLRGFLPSTGWISKYREPAPVAGEIRVDSGVVEGDEVTIHYDPLLAKLICHGADRAAALDRLRGALDRYLVRGPNHNIEFLSAVAAQPRFADGHLSTDFIADKWPDGFAPEPLSGASGMDFMSVALLVHLAHLHPDDPGRPVGEGAVAEWWLAPDDDIRTGHLLRISPSGAGYRVSMAADDDRPGLATPMARQIAVDWRPGEALVEAELDGRRMWLKVTRQGLAYRLVHGGHDAAFWVVPPHVAPSLAHMPRKLAADTRKLVTAPMPGLLASMAVEVGQEVKAGEALAVIEAMKMENILRAEHDGTVATLHAAPGDNLAVDQAILEFE